MIEPVILEAVQELKKRNEHPIRKYTPGDVEGWDQLSFHKSTARFRLLFGGNRSGKSFSNSAEIAWWAMGKHPYRTTNSPPVKIWVISVEYVTILEGIYNHLRELIPEWEVEKYGPQFPTTALPSYIKLKNGSIISFKSAKESGSGTRQKFQAASVDLIVIDEEVGDTIFDEIEARTLDRGGQFTISATLVESYDWIVEMEDKFNRGDSDFFVTRLNTELNPYLHAETVQKFKNRLSQEEREVRLEGRSRRSTGLIYNTFTNNHVVDPFPVPISWPRYAAFDPGIRVFAGLWVAIAPDGSAYAYREIYLNNTPLYEIAYIIKNIEGYELNKELSDRFEHYVWEDRQDREQEYIVCRLIDDKRGSRLITGDEGVMDQLFNRYGIACTPADKAKRPGIEDCRHWLDHGFKVFSNLENFIWEIKRYRIRKDKTYKDRNAVIDEPIKKDDHLMDCWRYIARENPKYERDRRSVPIEPQHNYHQTLVRKWQRKKEYVEEFLGVS